MKIVSMWSKTNERACFLSSQSVVVTVINIQSPFQPLANLDRSDSYCALEKTHIHV